MRATYDVPRTVRHRLLLPCLNCGDMPVPCEFERVRSCPTCGVAYSEELLATAHPEAWAFISAKRLFCFECGSDTAPTVYQSDDGRPVPCPHHGPAPQHFAASEGGSDG